MTMVKSILKAFRQKPIAVYPIYIAITGDPHSAMALSQILYWHDVADGEFYKTDEELASEIYATPEQMKRIKKVLHSLSFLKITLRQVPAKTFYDIDLDSLGVEINRVMESSSLGEKAQTRSGEKAQTRSGEKAQTRSGEKAQTRSGEKAQTNTENTYRDYTETTTENKYIREKSVDKSEKKKVVGDNSYELLAGYGIEGDLAEDFIQHRKSKKAVINRTVLNSIQKEANLANIPLSQAIETMLLRNWQGFNHEWIRDKQPPTSGKNRDFTTPAQYLGADPFQQPQEKVIN